RSCFGGIVYFETWAVEGSRTRRSLSYEAVGGTTAGGVGPVRRRPRTTVTDQRVGTSLPGDAWQAMRSGGATPPLMQSIQLDLALQELPNGIWASPVVPPKPSAGKQRRDRPLQQGPLVAVRLDPALLIPLLKAAAALGPENGVELLYNGRGKPLGLRTRNAGGQAFDGLLMPLS